MNGKIKSYNSEKGYGFMSSDEGDIFFHISDVKEGLPYYGLNSTYEIEITSRGKKAINIVIEANNAKGQFISIGGERIRGKNISEYKVLHYDKDFILEFIKSLEKREKFKGLVDKMEYMIVQMNISKGYEELGLDTSYKDRIKGLRDKNEIKVLYINTYQNREYRFCEGIHVEDVDEEMRKINKYFDIKS